MTTEVLNGAEPGGTTIETGTPAAAQPNAATAQPQTDGGEGGEGVPAAAKTFTQQDVDDIVKREKAKAEAKAERRVLKTLDRVMPHGAQQPAASQQQPKADDRPTRREGESDDSYFDRIADWKLDQRDRRAAQERQSSENQKTAQKTQRIYAEAEKLPGFDREAFDDLAEKGLLTRSMVEALIDSDHAAKLMLFMATNAEDMARIAALSPARQAAELGKLEAKIAATPTPKPSKAPTPITPVGGGNTPITDLASASMDDYVAQRRKQGAAWAR